MTLAIYCAVGERDTHLAQRVLSPLRPKWGFVAFSTPVCCGCDSAVAAATTVTPVNTTAATLAVSFYPSVPLTIPSRGFPFFVNGKEKATCEIWS